MVQGIEVHASALATHSPVSLDLFSEEGPLLTQWVKPKPPKLARVFGPLFQADWGPVLDATQTVRQELRRDFGTTMAAARNHPRGRELVEHLYEQWRLTATDELSVDCLNDDVTEGGPPLLPGSHPAAGGRRGITPV